MSTLNLTAISAANGASIFECWALQPGFVTSSQMGVVGSKSLQLGNLANASYTLIPPHFEAGLHHAPNVQYVVFTSGFAHVSLPNSTASAYIEGGENGIIIAADTINTVSVFGHNTSYPSDQTTTALQIPTENGLVPDHVVLHEGPCHKDEMLNAKKRMGVRPHISVMELDGLD